MLEEAVHLLRSQPAELGLFYAGTAPFVVGFVFFWAYVTWFVPPDGEVALGALLLALLFGCTRAVQHRCALRLRAHLTADPVPSWKLRDWLRETAAQLRLQAPAVVVLPLAAVFGVPFGWAYAYFQNLVALPAQPGVERKHAAWEQATLWPAQNHWGLGILSVLWLAVFLNLAVAFYAVPALATNWLGLRTIFALSGWSYFNTTFLISVAALTHLAVGPLITAFYVVRVFRGGARRTGADILLVLRREQRARATAAGLMLALLLTLALPTGRAAAPSSSAPVMVESRAIDRALDDVLARPDFRWRLKPVPAPTAQKKDGIVQSFVRATFQTIREILRTVWRWFGSVKRWVSSILPGGDSGGAGEAQRGAKSASLRWMDLLQVGAYVLLFCVVGLLVWVVWKVVEQSRSRPVLPAPAAGGGAGATPDLHDESVQASALPAHEWLELARTKLAAGEWRLAWRALFLATLATHAHDGLLSLAKFKTNLDYERELRRRALGRVALVEEFGGRRRAFEAVWYGNDAADAEAARAWLQQMEARK